MKMTRGEHFLRAKKLREMSKHEPDGIVLKGIQSVMLGALIGTIGIAALIAVMGQGR